MTSTATHKVPVSIGGTDEYANLVLVLKDVHVLIHATSETTMKRYLDELKLEKSQLEKLNKLRIKAEMPLINL